MYFLYFIACLFWIVTLHFWTEDQGDGKQLINKPGLADSGQYALKERKWTGLSREEVFSYDRVDHKVEAAKLSQAAGARW